MKRIQLEDVIIFTTVGCTGLGAVIGACKTTHHDYHQDLKKNYKPLSAAALAVVLGVPVGALVGGIAGFLWPVVIPFYVYTKIKTGKD